MNSKELLEFLRAIYSQIPDPQSTFWADSWIKKHPRLARRLLRFKSDASGMMKPVQFEVARVELEERRQSMQVDAFPQFRPFVPPPLTEEQKELIAFNDRVPETTPTIMRLVKRLTELGAETITGLESSASNPVLRPEGTSSADTTNEDAVYKTLGFPVPAIAELPVGLEPQPSPESEHFDTEIKDGARLRIVGRQIAVIRKVIAPCKADHSLERVEYEVNGVIYETNIDRFKEIME